MQARSGPLSWAARSGLFLALAMLALMQLVLAQPSESPSPSPPEPTPASMPLAELADSVQAARDRLDDLQALLLRTGPPADEEARLELPTLRAEIDAELAKNLALLNSQPSLDGLRAAEASWKEKDHRLTTWRESLKSRATSLDTQVQELDTMAASWTETLEQARSQAGPLELLEQVQNLQVAIQAGRGLVEERRKRVLSLLNEVVGQSARVSRALESIQRVRGEAVQRILVQDSPPIWSAQVRDRLIAFRSDEVSAILAGPFTDLSDYARRHAGTILAQILLLFCLTLALRWAHRKVVPWVRAEPRLKRTAEVFNDPFGTALVLAAALGSLLYPQAPPLLLAVMGTLALVPAAFLLRRVLDWNLLALSNALVLFYLVDLIRAFITPLDIVSHLLFLAEMLAGGVFMAWLWFSLGRRPAGEPEVQDRVLSLVARIGMAVFAVALVTSAAGYVRLGYLVGNGVLVCAYQAVLVYASVRILDGLVMLALRTRPLGLLGVVQSHRPKIRRRITFALKVVGLGTWVVLALETFSVRELVFAWLGEALRIKLELGAVRFALGDVLAFGLTLWGALLLSRFARFMLEEDVYPRLSLPRGIPFAFSTLLHYLVLLVGFLMAVAALGIDTTRFAIIAGALGVGIGLGLQSIVNNFVSGLIVLFERPVKVGDFLEIGETSGTLTQIGLRACVLRTLQGADIIVPNARMIADTVTNWTLTDLHRRLDIQVGVEYGSDPNRVCQLLAEAAGRHPRVLAEPEARVMFLGFGDSSLNFQLRAWTAAYEHWVATQSELTIQVYETLTAAGIGIPFPQRTLHLHREVEAR